MVGFSFSELAAYLLQNNENDLSFLYLETLYCQVQNLETLNSCTGSIYDSGGPLKVDKIKST